MNDIKTTPVSNAMPGVEIHAQVLESALTGSSLSRPAHATIFEFLAALVAGLLVIAFAPNLGPATAGLALGALFATGLIGTSWYAYQLTSGKLLDFTYPLMSTTAIYLTLIFSSFVSEQRKRAAQADPRRVRPVPVAGVVEQLARSPDKLELGGENRTMSFMFSDVRGFTTISELFSAAGPD